MKNNNENGPLARQVAVVVPVVRLPLSVDEEISLRHLRTYLGRFDRYVVGLQNLPEELSDFQLKPFAPRYFTGRYAYNRLLLKEEVRVRRVHSTERHQESVTLRHHEAVVTRIPVEPPAAGVDPDASTKSQQSKQEG